MGSYRDLQIVSRHPVEDAVAPAASSEGHAAADTFTTKARLLQCALLRNVADLGAGLEAMCGRRREKVRRKLPLRLGSNAATTMLRKQGNADLQSTGTARRRRPGDPTGKLVIAPDRQIRLTRPDEPVVAPLPLEFSRAIHAKAEPLPLPARILIDEQTDETRQVISANRPKLHRRGHGTMISQVQADGRHSTHGSVTGLDKHLPPLPWGETCDS